MASVSVSNYPTTLLLAWHSWEVLRLEKPEYLSIQGPFLFSVIFMTDTLCTDRGSTVVKVLCYKSEGRWFDPSWDFSLT